MDIHNLCQVRTDEWQGSPMEPQEQLVMNGSSVTINYLKKEGKKERERRGWRRLPAYIGDHLLDCMHILQTE